MDPGGELRTLATFFALAVVWDYLWFVLNPAYTVRRFERGKVWWFEVPWLWRFPLDYYAGLALSLVLAGLSAWAAGSVEPLRRHLWTLAGLAILVAVTVLAAPLYHRWYRHMRRPVTTIAVPSAPIRRRPRGSLGRRRADPALRRGRENDMRTWPLAFGAAAGAAGWGIYNAISPKGQGFGKSFVGTPGKGRLMALTFDDGPNTAWTPAPRGAGQARCQGDLFSVGHYAREQPSLLKQVADAGHAVGNHTYTHVTMPLHTDETIRRDATRRGRSRMPASRWRASTGTASCARRTAAAAPALSASSGRRATCRSSGRSRSGTGRRR